MSKEKTVFICDECGWESPKWAGQCRSCQSWGTLSETTLDRTVAAANKVILPAAADGAQPITEVSVDNAQALTSGIDELDRVLGSGITPGAVILLAGEPGVGKSTLLLDMAAKFGRTASTRGDGPVLYVTGEETVSQVRVRAERIGALTPHLRVIAENDLSAVLGQIAHANPSLVVVDSVQTMSVAGVEGSVGGTNQTKAVTNAVIQTAKETNTPTVLVGHVTKEGALAGPRTLEHLVDVVCQFTGDPHTSLRLLRSTKNRYGATDEVGCFQLTDTGIEQVRDPSEIFMSQSLTSVPGSCVTVTLEGQRPLTTEIQALVTDGGGGSGRRTVSGVSTQRAAMILAVIQAHLKIDLRNQDVYISTVGGARATEPATDLAIALAVLSAAQGTTVPRQLLAIGEVGLTGDVRRCQGLNRRLQEAGRLGFMAALIPSGQVDEYAVPGGIATVPVRSLLEAANYALP